jgi:hypothetical protein
VINPSEFYNSHPFIQGYPTVIPFPLHIPKIKERTARKKSGKEKYETLRNCKGGMDK